MSPASLAALARDPRTSRHPEVRSRLRIPMGGVVVTRHDAKNHRYLRDRGLPHSPTVASVLLPRRWPSTHGLTHRDLTALALVLGLAA